MFFRRRSTQAEYFDLHAQSEAVVLNTYRELDRMNRFFGFTRPFREMLPPWLGNERCSRLDILDVGAGTGLLAQMLSRWAQQRGWTWRFTNLDSNPAAIRHCAMPNAVNGSCLALPFTDGSFDLVIASQMTHHLTDEEVVVHLREAWRVTRHAMFICDLHRNAGLYTMLWLSTILFRMNRLVRQDALISVKRGFRGHELRGFALEAGLGNAEVKLSYGTRIVLLARKTLPQASQRNELAEVFSTKLPQPPA
jgi:SAM-dependent methyltransferase